MVCVSVCVVLGIHQDDVCVCHRVRACVCDAINGATSLSFELEPELS